MWRAAPMPNANGNGNYQALPSISAQPPMQGTWVSSPAPRQAMGVSSPAPMQATGVPLPATFSQPESVTPLSASVAQIGGLSSTEGQRELRPTPRRDKDTELSGLELEEEDNSTISRTESDPLSAAHINKHYELPSDVYRYGFYAIVKERRMCHGIGIILFLVFMQMFLVFAVWAYTFNELRAENDSIDTIYGDIAQNLGKSGFRQLQADEAEEYCGRFGDDYCEDDCEPYNRSYTYAKLPLKNWNIWSLVEDNRSLLDNMMYRSSLYSVYSVCSIIAMSLWVCAVFNEFNDIHDFAAVTWGHLPEINELGSDVDSDESSPDDGSMPFGKDVTEKFNQCTPCAIKCAITVITLIRFVGATFIGAIGVYMLGSTSNMLDLILNSMGLTFVLEVDNTYVYRALVTRYRDVAVKEYDKVAKPYNPWWWEVLRSIKQTACGVILVAFFISFVMRVCFITIALGKFYKISAMCLFLGANPDNSQAISGVFPVAGFCESLLDTTCELPQDWADGRCLFDRDSAKQACELYHDLPPHTDYQQWQAIAKETDFCSTSSGGKISKVSIETPQKFWWLNPYRDHNQVLKWVCLKMWQPSPAMKSSKMIREVKDTRAPTSYPTNFTPKLEAFPRMRDSTRVSRLFAGPFACPFETAEDKNCSTEECPMRRLLGLDADPMLPLELDDTNVVSALESCRASEISKKTGGFPGDKCAGHQECLGFCSRSGASFECSHCDGCTACSRGYYNNCGQCSRGEELRCESSEPTILQNKSKGRGKFVDGWTEQSDESSKLRFATTGSGSQRKSFWPRDIANNGSCGTNCLACPIDYHGTYPCLICAFGTKWQEDSKGCVVEAPVFIRAGDRSSFYKMPDGTIWATGAIDFINLDGIAKRRLRESTGSILNVPALLFTNFTDVAIGPGYAMFLKAGQVWAIGSNGYGQLGLGGTTYTYATSLTRVEINNVRSIHVIASATDSLLGGHTAFLKNDGSVWTTGENTNGQLCLNHTTSYYQSSKPQKVSVPGNKKIKDVALGWYHTVLLADDGTVYSCGSNSYQQLGLGRAHMFVSYPFRIRDRSFASVSAARKSTFGVTTDGQLYAAGSDNDGTFFDDSGKFVLVPGINNVKEVAYPLLLKRDGTLWATKPRRLDFFKLDPTSGLTDKKIDSIAVGAKHAIVLTERGELYRAVWDGTAWDEDASNTDDDPDFPPFVQIDTSAAIPTTTQSSIDRARSKSATPSSAPGPTPMPGVPMTTAMPAPALPGVHMTTALPGVHMTTAMPGVHMATVAPGVPMNISRRLSPRLLPLRLVSP